MNQLDLQLLYLWKVHGTDYYGGRELSDPSDSAEREAAKCTSRGQRPEEGEQADEAAGEFPSVLCHAQTLSPDKVALSRLVRAHVIGGVLGTASPEDFFGSDVAVSGSSRLSYH